MLTAAELARNWGVTPQYASQCVKAGCPLTDLESARLWRQANVKRSRKNAVEKRVAQELEDDSPEARERRRQYLLDKPEGWQLPTSLDHTLENSAKACEQAWYFLNEAMIEGKSAKISVWLTLHTRAVEARVKAERMIREEQERQKVLIPISESQTSTRRVVEIVVSRLTAMPQNLAHAVNPSAPDHAFEILQRECSAIVADTQKAIA
jgi:hypothetical protein